MNNFDVQSMMLGYPENNWERNEKMNTRTYMVWSDPISLVEKARDSDDWGWKA